MKFGRRGGAARTFLGAAVFLLAAAAMKPAAALEIPDEAAEYQIGKNNYAERRDSIIETGALAEKLQKILASLKPNSEARRGIQYRAFLLRNDPGRDFQLAASFPGGFIYIREDLAKILADRDGEMAFIIGHEMAHIDHRHSRISTMTEFSIRAQMTQLGRRKSFQESVSKVDQDAWLLEQERQQEFEADRYGLLYMVKSGYDPKACGSALQLCNRYFGTQTESPEYLKTHPSDENRIAALETTLSRFQDIYRRFQEGVRLLQSGDAAELDSAQECFEKFLSLYDNSREAHNNLGVAHLKRAGRERTLAGLIWDPVIEPIQKPLFTLQGGAAQDPAATLLSQAEEEFRLALQLDETDSFARLNLGLCLMFQGKPRDGVSEIRKAGTASQTNPKIPNAEAVGYFLQGDYRAAAAALEKAARKFPASAELWYNLGVCRLKMGDAAGARAAFRKFLALEKDADSLWVREARARL